jgi:CHRD domain
VSLAQIRLGSAAAALGALGACAALTLALAAPAAASPSSADQAGAPTPSSAAAYALSLRAMPAGVVRFGRSHGHLTVRIGMSGLTPGSSHNVDLVLPGRHRIISFAPLTATSAGQAHAALGSHFTGRPPWGSRLVIRMGVAGGRVAREPIAETRPLSAPGRRAHRLKAVEVGPRGHRWGTPRGRATIAYNARRHTLTVTVHASGITPGPHAAHIHLGSCQAQGPVLYMLKDLVASRLGRIRHAVRVFTNVTSPIPARGWYLNIHQGNSGNILRNGQPTIFFRPLICANITKTHRAAWKATDNLVWVVWPGVAL